MLRFSVRVDKLGSLCLEVWGLVWFLPFAGTRQASACSLFLPFTGTGQESVVASGFDGSPRAGGGSARADVAAEDGVL